MWVCELMRRVGLACLAVTAPPSMLGWRRLAAELGAIFEAIPDAAWGAAGGARGEALAALRSLTLARNQAADGPGRVAPPGWRSLLVRVDDELRRDDRHVRCVQALHQPTGDGPSDDPWRSRLDRCDRSLEAWADPGAASPLRHQTASGWAVLSPTGEGWTWCLLRAEGGALPAPAWVEAMGGSAPLDTHREAIAQTRIGRRFLLGRDAVDELERCPAVGGIKRDIAGAIHRDIRADILAVTEHRAPFCVVALDAQGDPSASDVDGHLEHRAGWVEGRMSDVARAFGAPLGAVRTPAGWYWQLDTGYRLWPIPAPSQVASRSPQIWAPRATMTPRQWRALLARCLTLASLAWAAERLGRYPEPSLFFEMDISRPANGFPTTAGEGWLVREHQRADRLVSAGLSPSVLGPPPLEALAAIVAPFIERTKDLPYVLRRPEGFFLWSFSPPEPSWDPQPFCLYPLSPDEEPVAPTPEELNAFNEAIRGVELIDAAARPTLAGQWLLSKGIPVRPERNPFVTQIPEAWARRAYCRDLAARLIDGESICLTGPRGFGKTSALLCVQQAAERQHGEELLSMNLSHFGGENIRGQLERKLRAAGTEATSAIVVDDVDRGLSDGAGVMAALDRLGLPLLVAGAQVPGWLREPFSVEALPPLDDDDARRLLTRSHLIWSPTALDRAVKVGRGHPYLLQLIGARCFERLADGGRHRVEEEDLQAALRVGISELPRDGIPVQSEGLDLLELLSDP